MKDPLRDNRIFPEEMQQKPTKKKPKNYTSVINTILVVIIAIVLGYLGYQAYRASLDSGVVSEEERFQEESSAFEAIKRNQKPITAEERERKINALFNGESN